MSLRHCSLLFASLAGGKYFRFRERYSNPVFFVVLFSYIHLKEHFVYTKIGENIQDGDVAE